MARPTRVFFDGTNFVGSSTWDGTANTAAVLTSTDAVTWTPVATSSDPSGGAELGDLAHVPSDNVVGQRDPALPVATFTITDPDQGTMNSTAYAQLLSDIANANTELQTFHPIYYGLGTRFPIGDDWVVCDGYDSTLAEWKAFAACKNTTQAAVQDTNGVWLPVTLPVAAPWVGGAYGNGYYMLIAGTDDEPSDIALMSGDGENWIRVYAGGAQRTWRDITWFDNQFVVVPGSTTQADTLVFWAPPLIGAPSLPAGLQTGSGFSVEVLATDWLGQLVTLGVITGGSGYTDGTYNDIRLYGDRSFADTARATITVTGGAVTGCVLSYVGIDYLGPNDSDRVMVWDQDAFLDSEFLIIHPTMNIGQPGILTGSGFQTRILEVTDIGGVQYVGDFEPGSGYTDGTYYNVWMNGTVTDVTSCLATIVVSGGVVTGFFITNQGGNNIDPNARYIAPNLHRSENILPSAGDWRSVVYGGSQVVAVRSGTNQAAKSTDAITWTSVTLPVGTDWSGSATLYLDATSTWVWLIFHSGSSSEVIRSTDWGDTWASQTLPSSQTWTAVSNTRGRCVVAAPNTVRVAQSLDGITWTANTLSRSAGWSSIGFDTTTGYIIACDDRFPMVRKYGVDSAWRSWYLEYVSGWSTTTLNNIVKTDVGLIGFGTGTLRLMPSLMSSSDDVYLDGWIITGSETSEEIAAYLDPAWRSRNLMWIGTDIDGSPDTWSIYQQDPSEPTITYLTWTGTQAYAANSSTLWSVPTTLSATSHALVEEATATTDFGGDIIGITSSDGLLYVATSAKTYTAEV